MSDQLNAALEYARTNRARILAELEDLLKIPSISTDTAHAGDMQRAAEWLGSKLQRLGAQRVQIFPTGGSPVVYAEDLRAGGDAPTVLIYGHYDVQPAEPLDLWESGAFEPEIRGDNLYARGATDMKGQIMATLAAWEAITQQGKPPVNVKFLFEGEEEIGSTHLGEFIASHKELLASDLALNPDTGTISPDLPTITYALRGLAYFELWVYGPTQDLHSGLFGGVVHNPAQALCELIAGMHDESGRVTLPGFYANVRAIDAEERAELSRIPIDNDTFLIQTGVPSLWGEAGYTPIERIGARPTLEVNGLYSGFTGEGSKTVLPAKAMAKISCRLVPDQTPGEILAAMKQYLANNAPATVRCEVKMLSEGQPAISDRNSRGVKAMLKAMEANWNTRPVFRREGGTIPVVAQFQEYLGIESINCGFALPEDNMHAPNEKIHLPTWKRGINTLIHFFYNLGAESK